MIVGKTNSGLEIYRDPAGHDRVLGRLPLDARHAQLRAAMPTFGDYLASRGKRLIPRSEWQEVNRRGVLGKEFINDQRQCSGCVGWSAAGATMRSRALRGHSFQKLSGAYIYAHINGGHDGGAMITAAMGALEKYGTCLESEFDYPHIYESNISAEAKKTAERFKLVRAVTCGSFDELGTAIQMGFVVQFPIQVGSNYSQFDQDGACGVSPGYGNHSIHADGMKKDHAGKWMLDNPGSWGLKWGHDGRAYIREEGVEGCAGENDAFIHIDESSDPQDQNNPPVFS